MAKTLIKNDIYPDGEWKDIISEGLYEHYLIDYVDEKYHVWYNRGDDKFTIFNFNYRFVGAILRSKIISEMRIYFDKLREDE